MPSYAVRVVFATPVFGGSASGPETYARYLWEGLRDDPEIDFHVVASEFPTTHPKWHESGKAGGSLDLYRRVAAKAMSVANELSAQGGRTVLHVNNSNLHSSLLNYDGLLWGQVNDYESAELWRRAGDTMRRAGLRRFLSLVRRRWLERRLVARQDLTLCNSDFTRLKILSEYKPLNAERIKTLHKAVDLDFYRRPQAINASQPSATSSTRHFVFVGSDFVRKGLDVLLQAVSNFPADFSWRLSIVGVSREEAIEAFPRMATLVMHPRVALLGTLSKEELRKVLWEADIFVLPSRAEAFGVALLEALAAGLPVVATNVGGIPEIVSNKSAGVLVPPDDFMALAEAMLNTHPWPAGRQPGEVMDILEHFSTRAMIARLRELYLHVA